jgi:hypothetical protein
MNLPVDFLLKFIFYHIFVFMPSATHFLSTATKSKQKMPSLKRREG